MNKKICVYTCITGNYDNLLDVNKEESIDYFCFTNNKNIQSKTWKVILLEDNETNNLSDIVLSRKIKILGHDIIKNNYDISIYVDGTMLIVGSIKELLIKYNYEENPLIAFKHSARDCIYEELAACLRFRKEKYSNLEKMYEIISSNGYPRHNGLCENGVLIRHIHDKNVNKVMEDWFQYIKNYSYRDQLSFNFCLYKNNVHIKMIEENIFNNEWFLWKPHNSFSETNNILVFFDKYNDIKEDVYLEYYIDGEEISLNFQLLKDCKSIILNLGKHLGKYIQNFNVKGIEYEKIIYYPCLFLNDLKIFRKDDLSIFIKGDFIKGQNVEVKFSLHKIKDFYNLKLEKDIFSSSIMQLESEIKERDDLIYCMNRNLDYTNKQLECAYKEIDRINRNFIRKAVSYIKNLLK